MIHYNIAITGKMRSGKDTVQRVLTKALIYQITSKHSRELAYPIVSKFAFGDAVKKYSKELFPDFYKGNSVKQRKLLQDFGQSMRQIDRDIWVKALDRELQKKIAVPSLFEGVFLSTELETILLTFITDVRQPNEFEYVKELGITIKVEASDEVRKARMIAKGEEVSDELFNHETESHIDGYQTDFIVENSLDETKLHEELQPVIQYIIKDILSQV